MKTTHSILPCPHNGFMAPTLNTSSSQLNRLQQQQWTTWRFMTTEDKAPLFFLHPLLSLLVRAPGRGRPASISIFYQVWMIAANCAKSIRSGRRRMGGLGREVKRRDMIPVWAHPLRHILMYVQELHVSELLVTAVFLTLIPAHVHAAVCRGRKAHISLVLNTSPVTLSFLLTEQMPALLWLKLLSLGFHQRLLSPPLLSFCCGSLDWFLSFITQLHHWRLDDAPGEHGAPEGKLLTAVMWADGRGTEVTGGVDQSLCVENTLICGDESGACWFVQYYISFKR